MIASATTLRSGPAAMRRNLRPPAANNSFLSGPLIPFLLGAGAFVNVKLVGYITLSEIVVVVAFFGMLITGQLSLPKGLMRWVLIFSAVWIVTALGTDIYRFSPFPQTARGVGRTVVFFCVLATSFPYLASNPQAIKPFFVGLIASSIVNIFGFRAGAEEFVLMSGQEMESSWERHYTYATLMSALAIAAYFYKRFPWVSIGIIIPIGILNIAMGSRNIGATIAAGALVGGVVRFLPRSRGAPSLSARLGLLVMIIVVGAATFVAYKAAASRGWFGPEAKEKYELQADSPVGMLFYSRANVLGGLLAIKDSPVIGYGSWPLDANGYLLEAFRLSGNDPSYKQLLLMPHVRIPSHSMILEAWVEHGILAMIFWLIVSLAVWRVLTNGMLRDPEWGLFLSMLALWMIWNMAFSPFGNRIFIGVVIVILVLAADMHANVIAERSRSSGT